MLLLIYKKWAMNDMVVNSFSSRNSADVWRNHTILEICDDKKGSIKIGPFGSQLKKEFLISTGYKVYGQENVYTRNMEIGNRYISKSHFQELKTCEIIPGDFIISMMGTIGKCMVVPLNIEPGIIDSHLIRLRLNKNKIDPIYFAQLFGTKEIQDQISNLSVGGIMAGLSSAIIKKIVISFPPLPEQRAIAEVLSNVDTLITSLDALIAKKRAIKQGVMQELLTGKRRLPGFNEKWEEKSIGELLVYEQPTKYIVKSTDYNPNNGIPVLTANKSFILGYTNEEFGIYNNLPVIIFDDFITDSKFVNFPFKVKSSAIKLLRPKSDLFDIRFVFEKMQLIDFVIGEHKRHYISEYQYIKFSIPNFAEQKAISEILENQENEIMQLTQKLEKLKLIKIGMMQELLTGRIRLQ